MTPISTQPQLATTPTVALSNEQELQRAVRIAANAISSSYQLYGTPELSDSLDKNQRQMISILARCKLIHFSLRMRNGLFS
ncbi:hypothetical protein PSTT_04744 [Puccinia striiformis]|uniref:Uncharacterized protein n=1 Tax=Puccinia striiformis TaxID=27350 RepID=A0A2S4VRW8_9BASI|nr:hypothetical protein PSTT_04744 [Puccinia striiformis]